MIKKFILICCTLILYGCDRNEEITNLLNTPPLVGTGSFIYNQYDPFINKPIEVFYHVPENLNNDLPILISLHGAERNGSNHRNTLISKSNQLNFIVIVPQFSNDFFTGGDGYNLANIFVDGDNPSPSTLNLEDKWTFSVLDPIFNYVKNASTNTSNKYNLIGFSAGGQLAHRTFLFGNSIFRNTTVAMSSGWYTSLDDTIDFPYGLSNGPFQNNDLNIRLSKQLIILVGANDNDPNAAGLRRNSIVDLQGLNRLDRANHFFTLANSIASNQNINCNWEKFIVPNAAHELSPISNYAINLLY